MMGIGKRIKELIHDLRLSQIEFAKKLDKFPQYISDVVNEKKNPGIDFINQIVDAFPQVNPEWLLNNNGPKFRTVLEEVQDPGVIYSIQNNSKLQDDIIKGLEANVFYLRNKVNKLEEENKQLLLELDKCRKLLEK
jgi:transcriptional regulator with XRE-family HTH domain